MKPKVLLFSVVVSSLIFVSSVYAALTISPDLTKSLTENEQATVTVTVSNSAGSSTESSIVTELSSSPSWFSLVTACSSISSLSGGQSQTSTCIIKPTSTGSGLTLTAISTSQGGTSGSGSTSGINVASQSASLTASISATSSVATSATFYVGITVAAPSANDVVNARATISASGQCEIDTSSVPAQQSLGNITKGGTKSATNWKLTSSSASGTCTVTVNVVSDVGGSASQSKSITVGTTSVGDTSAGGVAGGGAGGGGGVAAKPKVLVGEKEAIITIASIAAKSEVNFSIDSKTLSVTGMKVKAVNTVTNVEIKATKLDARPGTLVSDAPGVVNQYLDIKFNASVAAADVERVTIDFKVEKSWISANNINESTIALYRYVNDKWNKLETAKASEDDANVYYNATSPGLSVFAVSGESKITPAITPAAPTEEKREEKPEEKPLEELIKKDYWKIILVVGGVVIAVVIAVFFSKKNKVKSASYKNILKR